MNFFINTVSKKSVLILFDNNRQILIKKCIDVMWNESEKLAWIIDKFLSDNNIKYDNLENLIAVNWPGSFTWVRIIVLIINTINFIIWKNITDLSFFSLFNNYPIVKSCSKKDLFVKFNKNDKIEIIKNEDFNYIAKNKSIKKVFGDVYNENLFDFFIEDKINYDNIIRNLDFKKKKLIEPLYIKKPNIS